METICEIRPWTCVASVACWVELAVPEATAATLQAEAKTHSPSVVRRIAALSPAAWSLRLYDA